MRFQLRAWDDDNNDSWDLEFEAVELPRVLTRLCDFLRGAGFGYVNGMSVVSKGTNKDQQEWKYHSDDAGEYTPL